MSDRDVLVTGIGLVSCLGEGVEAHRSALAAPAAVRPPVDRDRFAPYSVHPLPEIDWSGQIPKRGDQRQMETWQRLGTYCAGLALQDAGIKDDEALCGTMDMIVAAGGGERDVAVDASIMEAATTRSDHDILLNEKLTTELRPTLFLAQLSNLLAGNISIVHKVTGSSHTFMGEEGAGVAAVETAVARIRAGRATHILVGASFQTEHPDMLLGYELGGYLHRGEWRPVWQRRESEGGGVVTGSGAAFLVLESRQHAEARGREPYARIDAVVSDAAPRMRAGLDDAIEALLERLPPPAGNVLALSGASGAHAATVAERQALERRQLSYRAFSSLTGHLKEAQFPFAVALAAIGAQQGEALPPIDAETEQAAASAFDAVVATAIGYHRSEGAALLRSA